jgi:hypothetical protein
VEAVNVPFFTKYIDDQNKFNADDTIQKSAEGMLNELLLWTESLKKCDIKKRSKLKCNVLLWHKRCVMVTVIGRNKI